MQALRTPVRRRESRSDSLRAAAARGLTSIVETQIGQRPDSAQLASDALAVAVSHQRWGTVAYLADYLFQRKEAEERAEPADPSPESALWPGQSGPGVRGAGALCQAAPSSRPDNVAPPAVSGGPPAAPGAATESIAGFIVACGCEPRP